MPAMYHPDSIKASFETEAIKADINMSHKMEFVCEEKKEGEKRIREMIRDYAEHHADVIVLGSFGAKMEGKGVEHADFRCIGSTTATVTRGCKAKCLVVSHTCQDLPLKNQRRFFCAIDGSDISHHAYIQAIEMMRKGDYMQVCFIETERTYGKEICGAYAQDMLSKKIKGVAKSFKLEGDSVTGEIIGTKLLEIAEGGEVGDEMGMSDIIVIGSHGLSTTLPNASENVYQEYKKGQRDANKKGSVAEQILNGSRSSVMVVTADSLLGGVDYELKLGTYKEWFRKATGQEK